MLAPMAHPVVGDASAELADRDLLDDALRRLEPEWRAVIVLHSLPRHEDQDFNPLAIVDVETGALHDVGRTSPSGWNSIGLVA
jgi:hypothetical protein